MKEEVRDGTGKVIKVHEYLTYDLSPTMKQVKVPGLLSMAKHAVINQERKKESHVSTTKS